jgi:hypothetical protein
MRLNSFILALALGLPAGLSAQSADSAKSKRSKVAAGAAAGAVAGAAAAATAAATPGSAPAGGTSAIPACLAGQVLYAAPVTPAAGAAGAANNSMMATAMGAVVPGGASMIDAAKKKYLKKDSSVAGAVGAGAVAGAATGAVQALAGGPTYLCGTPEQAAQSIQTQAAANQAAQAAQANQSGMPSVGSMLAATPQGMMVNGAVAAAPMAMAGAKKVGGMFFHGQTKESMAADLARGKLVMKGLKFVEGTDMLVADAENDIPLLGEALKYVEGQFVLTVPAESDGKSPPDVDLAKRRVARIAVHLMTSGIGEDRVTTRPLVAPSADTKPVTVKRGAARPELARVPKEPKP